MRSWGLIEFSTISNSCTPTPLPLRTAPQSVSRVMHVEKNAASPRAETSLKAAGILAESVELKPCQRLEQPGRARPSVHQTSGQSRDGLLFHGNGRANVARGGGDEHDWQGTVILSRFCGVGDQKEEFIESSLMGKMTFPLLNQGGLELTSVQRRETDVGRSWMRRARTRPGMPKPSRV